jgi:hypothetical protein
MDRREKHRWLYFCLFIVGVTLFTLCIWLDFRDGSPTMMMGDQPFEVVITGGLGIAALLNGLFGFWKSFKSDDEHRQG